MGDDVTNITIVEPTIEEEETYEAIGEELLSRLDSLDAKLGECYARIAELETRIAERGEFAAIEHSHDGFAPTEHTHEHEHAEYSLLSHEHETRTPKERKPDRAPEKQHPYFRKIRE
jgi:hypothetical protein